MFILQKISDEGTTEPFFARMMLQTMELRDFTLSGPTHEKEKLEFDREIEKLEKIVGGIEIMTKIPEAIFIL